MTAKVKPESFDSYSAYYTEADSPLNWPHIYSLPGWLRSWWDTFGAAYEPELLSLWDGNNLLGLAPLMRMNESAFLIGSSDLCDYLDFTVVPGKEREFMLQLLWALKERGLSKLELSAQRPEAAVFSGLIATPGSNTYPCSYTIDDHSYELALPSSWELYLSTLNKKQRHEVRRKIRHLEKNTEQYRFLEISDGGIMEELMPLFLNLFRENREKEAFLTEEREAFFRTVVKVMSEDATARLGLLETDGITAAAVLYFNYRHRIYLYNSGYLADYSFLSVGLLSKLLCIRSSIETGNKVFDFLKGEEVYKRRIGGNAVPIYKVSITLT